ncbi:MULTISPECIES: hypothetical protein [unclassified Micromonospora]|uniref:hypothetical protein n=1 Tax=unclassified Micromonospora TaxID=2617518 RepID=UPI00363CA1D4
MEYRQFVVPSDAELLDTLGVSPEAVEGEPTVCALRLTAASGDNVLISYDVPGRSFRIQVSSGNALRLDLLRESVTNFTVGAEDGSFRVRVALESTGLAGELEVLVGNEIFVRDRLLMA